MAYQNRSLIYSDWDLEAIVMNLSSDRDDDFAHAVDLIQQGNFEEADALIEGEVSRIPWTLILAAHLEWNRGNLQEAARYLRAVTLIARESLLELWAWHNLRRLGKSPPQPIANKVLGIIVEVPIDERTSDLFATYADGTARYINHQGGTILWDTYDDTITPMIFEGIQMARPMGQLEQFHSEEPVSDGEVRLTILTPAGMYIWEGSPEDGSDVARLFANQALLLKALVRLVLNRKGYESPDDL